MDSVRLVERTDGTWCAYIEGQEEDTAVAAPTDDAALGRLVRARPDRFGRVAIRVEALDPTLRGEPAGRFPEVPEVVGPDADAPEYRDPRRADADEGPSGSIP